MATLTRRPKPFSALTQWSKTHYIQNMCIEGCLTFQKTSPLYRVFSITFTAAKQHNSCFSRLKYSIDKETYEIQRNIYPGFPPRVQNRARTGCENPEGEKPKQHFWKLSYSFTLSPPFVRQVQLESLEINLYAVSS